MTSTPLTTFNTGFAGTFEFVAEDVEYDDGKAFDENPPGNRGAFSVSPALLRRPAANPMGMGLRSSGWR
jgi:hypothetical protein